ncbi:MAG: hypothetical protein K0S37_3006 [Microbacterium sp.]|jgi:hypothetical protein|nr:hypothetical protein [Microbacterium sp.]
MTTTFVVIATNSGEGFVHAGPGCTDVILTDSTRRGRGKIYAADEIRITDTALDDENLSDVLNAIVDACIPPNPRIVPLFAGIIHQAQLEGSQTRCCGHHPLDLPLTDRITNNPAMVTCGRYADRVEELTGITLLPWQRTVMDRLISSAGISAPAAPTTAQENTP